MKSRIDRLYPYIMILIAVVGLYISYRQYMDAKHDCDCQGTANKGTSTSNLRMM